MKSFVTVLFCALIGITGFSQSADFSNPTPVSTPFYTLGAPIGASLNNAIPSGLPTMDAAPGNDDVFYEFTAETRGIKAAISTGDFDLIIELWDGPVLLEGVNDVAGIGDEELWYSDLIPGNPYVIRVYSIDGAGVGNFNYNFEYLPKANIRDGYIPTSATYDLADGVPGYRLNNTISRKPINPAYGYAANINILIEMSMFRFTNVNTGDIHILSQTSGGFALSVVEDNGLLCPNEEYEVEAQVMLEGHWCGWDQALPIFTEPEPIGYAQGAFANQVYSITGALQMVNIGQGQEITWFFTTNNGATNLAPHQESNPANTWCNLGNIPCLRYGKTYEITIQATYCGIVGPISDPFSIFTEVYPKTKLLPAYATGTLSPTQLVIAETIYKAEQYAFQFAPIAPGDPNMIPTGPAVVAYSSNTSTFLTPMGLEIGQTYRAGVKSFIQYGDGCDDPQESDYGLFYETLIVTNPEPVDALGDFNSDVEMYTSEANNQLIKETDMAQNERAFVMDLSDENLDGNGFLDVYTLDGRLVLSQKIYKLEGADMLYYDLSNELPGGNYIYTLKANDQSFSQKIFIP